jgi:hypothetical protein
MLDESRVILMSPPRIKIKALYCVLSPQTRDMFYFRRRIPTAISDKLQLKN